MDTIRYKCVFICCLSLLYFFQVPFLYAQGRGDRNEKEVLAIGTSTIADGNLAQAKSRAISRALVKGVENYLVLLLGGQKIINNFERIIQEIIPRAREEIEMFNILAESQIDNKYKVLVRVRINEEVLDDKLREAGLVFMEGPPVKILFMISEEKDGTASFWWKDPEIHSTLNPAELSLTNVFQKRGFRPINRTLNIPEVDFSEDLRNSDLLDSDIQAWGNFFSADVVLYGRVVMGEKDVSLILKAIDVKHGIQMCQDYQAESVDRDLEDAGYINRILEKLVNTVAARLSPTIIRMSATDQEVVHYLDVSLNGLSNYSQFRAFKEFLKKDIKGVMAVRPTRFKKSSISIEVEFQGDTNGFLDQVLRHENLPFSVGAGKINEGRISLNLE